MGKKLLELAVEIVQAQASVSKMTAEEIEQALVRAYNALQKMNVAEEQGHQPVSAGAGAYQAAGASPADPLSSIQEDKVTCMECKAELRQLTANHLRIHHLTPREYKKKWGFPLKQPLSARVLTDLRSRSPRNAGCRKTSGSTWTANEKTKRPLSAKRRYRGRVAAKKSLITTF